MRPAENLIDDMQPAQTPQGIAAESFTDADAAVVRLIEIYERNTRFLRDGFEGMSMVKYVRRECVLRILLCAS